MRPTRAGADRRRSRLAEIVGEGGPLGVGETNLGRQLGEIAAGGDRHLAPNIEAEVVDRRDALSVALTLIDPGTHLRAVGEEQVDGLWEREPARELLRPGRRVVDLD